METWYVFNKIRYAADKWEWVGRLDEAGTVHGAARVNGQAERIGRESGWAGTVDGAGRVPQLFFLIPLPTFESIH